MVQKFQESEVLWPVDHHRRELLYTSENNFSKKSTKMDSKQSCPVNIPENKMSRFDNFEDEEEEKMVPPHEMLARRFNGKMAFSVCTGNGRTLKGRDLSKVRNSILRMTGFLEIANE
ncbi:hypothetical protein AQUCO_02200047v1 [Aquilegia coerulea]|uniref:Senescence regulator S40 n=1 Tax=Aquilegia coerulea TaxID=218851 RepID=A0A2G5DCU9_AQUCA|nr:hypothetical protein AQUCO_02200047v1 [Aquilegia coerulea]